MLSLLSVNVQLGHARVRTPFSSGLPTCRRPPPRGVSASRSAADLLTWWVCRAGMSFLLGLWSGPSLPFCGAAHSRPSSSCSPGGGSSLLSHRLLRTVFCSRFAGLVFSPTEPLFRSLASEPFASFPSLASPSPRSARPFPRRYVVAETLLLAGLWRLFIYSSEVTYSFTRRGDFSLSFILPWRLFIYSPVSFETMRDDVFAALLSCYVFDKLGEC